MDALRTGILLLFQQVRMIDFSNLGRHWKNEATETQGAFTGRVEFVI
jgi:hypothetical protein